MGFRDMYMCMCMRMLCMCMCPRPARSWCEGPSISLSPHPSSSCPSPALVLRAHLVLGVVVGVRTSSTYVNIPDPATLSRTHTQKRAARVGAAARRDGEGVNFRFITCMNVVACACYAIACAATRRQAQNSSGTPASAQVRCSGSGSRMDSAPASSEAVFGYAASWTIAW